MTISPAPSTASPNWTATPDPALQVNSVAISADGNSCLFGTSSEYGSGDFHVYHYDGAGALRGQWPFGPAGSTQGVFWVAVSADGQFAAAGGETASKQAGLLTAYRLSDGAVLLSEPSAARVSQVALSGDGSLLLAVSGDTVTLYRYTGSAYTAAGQQSFAGASCGSCALSPDGFSAVVACTIYHDAGNDGAAQATGQVVSLAIVNGVLSVRGIWPTATAVQRVAMAATGNYWGAALHDGSCALLGPANVSAPLWQYRPSLQHLGIAYGIDITETSAGRVVLACAANVPTPPTEPLQAPGGGYLYLVESVQDGAAQSPRFCWGSGLQYSGNPGVSLAREADKVTATDGQPIYPLATPPQETPGNFYLFDAASGAPLWRYPTPIMNWPMAITPDGRYALGGSDDGSVYFWQTAQD
jgi:WD40 repeat protein